MMLFLAMGFKFKILKEDFYEVISSDDVAALTR